MNLDDVDGRLGEAWAGTTPNGASDDQTAVRAANRSATRDAIADAVQPDHRERALEILASRETARNRFYRGD